MTLLYKLKGDLSCRCSSAQEGWNSGRVLVHEWPGAFVQSTTCATICGRPGEPHLVRSEPRRFLQSLLVLFSEVDEVVSGGLWELVLRV